MPLINIQGKHAGLIKGFIIGAVAALVLGYMTAMLSRWDLVIFAGVAGAAVNKFVLDS